MWKRAAIGLAIALAAAVVGRGEECPATPCESSAGATPLVACSMSGEGSRIDLTIEIGDLSPEIDWTTASIGMNGMQALGYHEILELIQAGAMEVEQINDLLFLRISTHLNQPGTYRITFFLGGASDWAEYTVPDTAGDSSGGNDCVGETESPTSCETDDGSGTTAPTSSGTVPSSVEVQASGAGGNVSVIIGVYGVDATTDLTSALLSVNGQPWMDAQTLAAAINAGQIQVQQTPGPSCCPGTSNLFLALGLNLSDMNSASYTFRFSVAGVQGESTYTPTADTTTWDTSGGGTGGGGTSDGGTAADDWMTQYYNDTIYTPTMYNDYGAYVF